MKLIYKLLVILSLALSAFGLQATEDVIEFKSAKEERLYRELILELRCPKCQNQNIADSNAVVAKDMRHKTIELVKQGSSKQEVIDYMVNRYGQFAHYRPPVNIATSLLWLLPLSFILLAFFLLWRRSRKSAPESKAEIPDIESLDKELESLINTESKQSRAEENKKS